MPPIEDRIKEQARRDARSFVEEFGGPIDTSTTDWDNEAWSDVARSFDLSHEESPWLYLIYRDELEAETERLTATS